MLPALRYEHATLAGRYARRARWRATIPTRAEVAQSVEHMTENHGVAGSIPALGILSAFRCLLTTICEAYGRHVVADEIAHPPLTSFAPLAGGAESIAVEPGAHEGGRSVGKWISAEQLQRRRVVLQQLDQQRDEPGMLAGR